MARRLFYEPYATQTEQKKKQKQTLAKTRPDQTRPTDRHTIRNFPVTPTPGIFSKVSPVQMGGALPVQMGGVLPVQMGGVLQYKLEVYCGVSLYPKL